MPIDWFGSGAPHYNLTPCFWESHDRDGPRAAALTGKGAARGKNTEADSARNPGSAVDHTQQQWKKGKGKG